MKKKLFKSSMLEEAQNEKFKLALRRNTKQSSSNQLHDDLSKLKVKVVMRKHHLLTAIRILGRDNEQWQVNYLPKSKEFQELPNCGNSRVKHHNLLPRNKTYANNVAKHYTMNHADDANN
jgi:uncharacterized protein YqgQ